MQVHNVMHFTWRLGSRASIIKPKSEQEACDSTVVNGRKCFMPKRLPPSGLMVGAVAKQLA